MRRSTARAGLIACALGSNLLFPSLLSANASEEIGVASFYGARHHGRRTASGERFDRNALTAAHRRLPFGARLRLTNLANGRQVVVRVNDRGPFIRGRSIDVAEGAARALGFVRAGTARVRMERLAAVD